MNVICSQTESGLDELGLFFFQFKLIVGGWGNESSLSFTFEWRSLISQFKWAPHCASFWLIAPQGCNLHLHVTLLWVWIQYAFPKQTGEPFPNVRGLIYNNVTSGMVGVVGKADVRVCCEYRCVSVSDRNAFVTLSPVQVEWTAVGQCLRTSNHTNEMKQISGEETDSEGLFFPFLYFCR